MELLQVKADRNMLSLELDQHKKKHELEVENLEREQQVHQQAEKRKALAMFRKVWVLNASAVSNDVFAVPNLSHHESHGLVVFLTPTPLLWCMPVHGRV